MITQNTLYKEDFNKNYVENLEKNHQYDQIVDYLSKFSMPTLIEQNELNRQIESIKTQATIYNNIMSNSDDPDAVNFAIGIQNGKIDENTKYGKKFSKQLNALGGDDANRISFVFYNDTFYNQFVDELSNVGIDVNKNNLLTKDNDGRKAIAVYKSDIKNVDGVIKTLNYFYSDALTRVVRHFQQPNVKIYGLGDDGHIVESSVSDVKSLARIINKCNNKYNSANIGDSIEIGEYATPITGTEFKGAKHQKLLDYFNAGKITPDQYKKYYDIINQGYEDQLLSESLFKKDVYVADDNDNFFKITDVDNIAAYNKVIREAVADGSRITFNAGMSGSKFGTIITIAPKADKNGNIPDQGNKVLNTNAQYRFFIPDLFDDDAEKSFNADTKTRAIKEFNLLKLVNGTKYLDDNISISQISDYGGIYEDKNTGVQKSIRVDEVMSYLNEYNMMNDAFSYYKQQYLNINRETSLYFNGESIIPRKTKDDLGKEIAIACLSMAKEIVPNEQSDDYNHKAYEMYIKLLNNIGYDGKRYLEIIRNTK